LAPPGCSKTTAHEPARRGAWWVAATLENLSTSSWHSGVWVVHRMEHTTTPCIACGPQAGRADFATPEVGSCEQALTDVSSASCASHSSFDGTTCRLRRAPSRAPQKPKAGSDRATGTPSTDDGTKSSSSRQVPCSGFLLTSFHVCLSGDKLLAKLCCHEHCTLQF